LDEAAESFIHHWPKELTYQAILINGDTIPSITEGLNLGIKAAIQLEAKYIHWNHTDFLYDDPKWFPVLREELEKHPSLLKICAANSRDPLGKYRIGQEQTWLMRTQDFVKYPNLFFEEKFIRCGGCEDYYQHLRILASGKLIAITPWSTIHHAGAQTRSKYDSNPHQLYNQQVFGTVTGLNRLVEVHQPSYFGCSLTDEEYSKALAETEELSTVLGLPERRLFTLPKYLCL
jgi:hypothetical protein